MRIQTLREHFDEFIQSTKLSPNSGKLWVDILLLFIVSALHFSILPSLLGGYIYLDLITPWLITTFVLSPLGKSIILAVIGGWVMETHSVAPTGIYICIYWMVAVGVHVTRSTLSWRHMTPWVLTYFASGFWVFLFESFLQGLSEASMLLNLHYLYMQLSELAFTVIVGLLLTERFRRSGILEEAI